jgi:hypothetical protein
MSSVHYYIQLLRTSFVTETAIPTIFLYSPEVIDVVQQFNWVVLSAEQNGWATLRKNITYRD